MLLLMISIAMLALAPLIYFYAARFPKIWRFLDTIITVLVTALVVLHLLPESMRNVGWGAIPCAFAGLFMPSLLERLWTAGAHRIHLASISLALFGLFVHGMLDGAALALPDNGATGGGILQLAVILHRLPAALFIWALFYPKAGAKVTGAILILLGCGTLAGFFGAATILAHIHSQAGAVFYLQALVAGSLLHIAFDRHDEPHDHAH